VVKQLVGRPQNLQYWTNDAPEITAQIGLFELL
jgi:hypothetical protein